jgi:hypothetical protein
MKSSTQLAKSIRLEVSSRAQLAKGAEFTTKTCKGELYRLVSLASRHPGGGYRLRYWDAFLSGPIIGHKRDYPVASLAIVHCAYEDVFQGSSAY